MKELMEIVQPLRYYDALIKVVTQFIKTETKERIGGFFGMILGTLAASFL